MMEGWKTWAGVAGLVVGAALNALGMDDAAKITYTFAVPMVVVGIGHKLDKFIRMTAKGLNSVADQLEQAAPETKQLP